MSEHQAKSLGFVAVVLLLVMAGVGRGKTDVAVKLVASGLPAGAEIALDLPPELRRANRDGGSCVHVSTENLLVWNGLYDIADWWSKQYWGGEYSDRLVQRMESANLRYAYTRDGDPEFIAWCVRTGRGCGVFYKSNHAVNVVGMDHQFVYLLDNNSVHYPERNGTYERVDRDYFMRSWDVHYGGFAWTIVAVPPPKVPVL